MTDRSKQFPQSAVSGLSTTTPLARTTPVAISVPNFEDADPLDEDRPDDRIRVLTQRQLNRLLFVAAESGSRLATDRSHLDRASWMYAPLRLFEGCSAVDACRQRDSFLRAMVLHRTGIALDMHPKDVDDLIDESWDILAEDDRAEDASPGVKACGTRASLADFGLGSPELFTARAVLDGPDGVVLSFAAFMAVDEEDAEARARARFGGDTDVTVLRGFDPSEPVAMSLLSEPVVDILMDVAADAGSPLAAGLDLFVEHGFAV